MGAFFIKMQPTLRGVQKYEAGEVMVSKAISNFLRVLERHPEEIEELEKQV